MLNIMRGPAKITTWAHTTGVTIEASAPAIAMVSYPKGVVRLHPLPPSVALRIGVRLMRLAFYTLWLRFKFTTRARLTRK